MEKDVFSIYGSLKEKGCSKTHVWVNFCFLRGITYVFCPPLILIKITDYWQVRVNIFSFEIVVLIWAFFLLCHILTLTQTMYKQISQHSICIYKKDNLFIIIFQVYVKNDQN